MSPPARLPVALPDRYQVSRHVANGGMAAVWAVQDSELGRCVAVKVAAEHLSEDPIAVERFKREARAAARLSWHPNVVTIYDVGEHRGRPFIVMALYARSLSDVLRSGERVARSRALDWLEQAASALDAAHEAGVVHRDVKPGNLLLDERGQLAIADFGIARALGEESFTTTGQILGTAAYLSPEQAAGQPATAASDRYSLAAVAYELLTGSRVFAGEHAAAQARQHLEADPRPASELAPDLGAGLDPVLDRGLAKTPQERWPTATGFVQALRAVPADGGPERTRVMAPVVPAAAPAPARIPAPPARRAPPAPPGRPGPARTAPPRRKRSAALLVVLAGVLGALVAVSAVALTSGEDAPPDERSTAQRAETSDATRERARRRRERRRETAPTQATGTTGTTPPTTPSPAAPASGDTAALNDQGYALSQAGRDAEAVPVLRQAVAACPADSERLNPCGYALYNLAYSLNRTGGEAEAVPLLERRLQRFSFRRGDVRRELARARAGSGGS